MAITFNKNLFESRYRDDFSEADNYHRILFNSGRAVQARELTQLQTIIQEELSRLGRHFFNDGALVTPGGVTVSPVEFIKLAPDQISSADVFDLIGVELTGSLSNAVVKVIQVIPAVDDDPDTLIVTYTDTSSSSDLQGTTAVRVLNNENLIGLANQPIRVQTTNTITNPHAGQGLQASVGGGSFFVKGRFVYCPDQTIIISKYNRAANATVGLTVTEDIITASDDDRLYDNTGSVPNRTSPGADRYRIKLNLAIKEQLIDSENFVYVCKVQGGEVVTQVKTIDNYNEIENNLARRTFEESGNYIVDPFILMFKDSVENSDYVDFDLDPGIAYVQGFRSATDIKTSIPVLKPRTTQLVANQTAPVQYGNYFLVESNHTSGDNKGVPNIDTLELVRLYNNYNGTGTQIGTARARGLTEVSDTQFRFHLFDIRIGSGYNKRSVKSIGYSTDSGSTGGYFNVTQENNNAILREGNNNSTLFPLPIPRAKTITNVDFNVQRRVVFVESGTTPGQYEAALTDGVFVSPAEWIIAEDNGVVLSPVASNPGSGEVVVGAGGSNLAILTASSGLSSLEAIVKVNRTNNILPAIKRITETSGTFTPSNGIVLLAKPDLYEIVEIRDTNSSGADISANFIVDNGQRDSYYDIARLIARPGVTAPATVYVKFKYFEISRDGDYFCVDSYEGIGLENIPSYTKSDGEVVALRDVFDFRSRMGWSGSAGSFTGTGALIFDTPSNNDVIEFDAQQYLRKAVKVVLTTRNEIKVIEGPVGTEFILPNSPQNSLDLYHVFLNPYMISANDLVQTLIRAKRYTMADIDKLSERVDRLEETTALSLLEVDTANLAVLDADGNPRTKSGFFVDNFADPFRSDTLSEEFRASINPSQQIMRPEEYENNIRLVMMNADSDTTLFGNTNIAHEGDFITRSFSITNFINQPAATETMNINPYEVITYTGTITLSPTTDEWSEVRYLPEIVIDGGDQIAGDPSAIAAANARNASGDAIIEMRRRRKRSTPVVVGTREWNWAGQPVGTTIASSSVESGGRKRRTRTTTTHRIVGRETVRREIDDRLVETALLPWMRSKRVYFKAQGLKPNNRIFCFFDGVNVTEWIKQETFQWWSSTSKDFGNEYTNATSHPFGNTAELYTDEAGMFEGSFFIPSGPARRFATGTKQFRILDISIDNPDGATSKASAYFTSTGILNTRQKTMVSTRVTRVATNVVTESVDPLAQSFEVVEPNGIFVKRIGVKFATKDGVLPVTCEIRPLENGYPSANTIIPGSVVTLNPSEVSVPTTAEASTILSDDLPITYFELPESIFLKPGDYCVVLKANTVRYNVYVAKAGDFLINTTAARVTKQPSLGSLFKSQNQKTWTADQDRDLAFTIDRCEFNTSSPSVLIMKNADVPTETLVLNSLSTTSGTRTITVNYPRHGLQIGDSVTVSGAEDIAGITSTYLNGTFTVTAIDGTGFQYNVSSSAATATNSLRGGGQDVKITRNIIFSTMFPYLETLIPDGTSVQYHAKYTSGTSYAADADTTGFTQIPYSVTLTDTDWVPVGIREDNYFTSPQMIASRENAIANSLPDNASLLIRVTLSTTDSKVSPIIDLQRASVTTLTNSIDKPVAAYSGVGPGQSGVQGNVPLNFVAETDPSLGSALSKYITLPITLENEAVGIKAFLAANRPRGTDFDLYYRTNASDPDAEGELFESQWTLVEPIAANPTDNDPEIFREYEYLIGGDDGTLDAFNRFQLKIVMTSTNESFIPIFRDLRTIAMTV